MKSKKLRTARWLMAPLLLTAIGVALADAGPVPVEFDQSAVQFIFTKISDSNYYPEGTCFTVEVITNHRPKNTFRWGLSYTPVLLLPLFGKHTIAHQARYFVTAKHVLFDANGNLRPRLYMRADNQSGVSYSTLHLKPPG
jgi:hypothetical protein